MVRNPKDTQSMKLEPLALAPIYKRKIWGGRNIQRLYGRELPADDIGESWEVADLEQGVSVVQGGPLDGSTLRQLVASMGADLLGDAKPQEGGFGLLVKLLDANESLSLQVHPDRAAVDRLPGAALKTECWYVLESRDGFIYKGLKPGVRPDDFRKAIENNTVGDCVIRHDVRAGDFHWLPAGTVHALGAGVVVAEVQTPSDTTYRVSDWGRGREIHIDLAMQCIHFDDEDLSPPGASGDVLVSCEFFTVARHTVAAAKPAGKCAVVMAVSPVGRVRIDYGQKKMTLAPGQTVLIPAALDASIIAESCEYLLVTLGSGEVK